MLEIFDNSFQNIIDLVKNGVLLFALVFIYGATDFSPGTKNTLKKLMLGLVIGIFAVFVMMSPSRASEGIIFDTRSVLLSVTGAFFGWITTLVAAIIATIYRIIIGGPGIYAGVLTIITTSSFGLLWLKIRKILPKMHSFYEYLIFGVIAHIITLLCQLAIPWPIAFEVIRNIWLPFLTLFPIFTALIAISIQNQINRLASHEQLKNQQLLLQASIDSSKAMEIFAVNPQYQYLAFNDFHAQSMKKYYQKSIQKEANYLDYIEDDHMHYRIKSFLDKSLKGESFTRIVEVETARGKYLEELYTPIRSEHGEIIGVTIFSQEITERKQHEESILYLSYHDSLTGLNNRRYYMEELERLNNIEFYPLSIIMADINGLKIMNDAFGHDAGDLLLQTVANELKDVFKDVSSVARIGGDEFVVLLQNTSKLEAMNFIEKAKKQIELNEIHGMKVSVSFGIATKMDKIPINEVIKLAEDDMYKHKLFEVSSNRNESIKTIMHTLHVKNPREEYHSKRVSEYCVQIGQAMGLRQDELDLLRIIGNLHDIGKIAIDDSILNKPGNLNFEEWAAIKRHPEIGYRILSSAPEYSEIAQDILSHHERWDGKGYPQGLSGKDIPYRARIIAIADAFDAMTSVRPYRQPMKVEEAFDEIEKNAGSQFDPIIARQFVNYLKNQKA